MPNLYTIATKNESGEESLSKAEIFAVVYHDIFDYPLNFSDLIRWKSGTGLSTNRHQSSVVSKNGYFFLEDREGLIYKRVLRERISKKKLEIAKKASRLLAFIPTVKMVAVTGSLSMGNSTDDGDIDLLIITKNGRLWVTRLFSYLLLRFFGMKIRSAGEHYQKDKLCLNMWMDEDDLVWSKNDRNVYSAHEIGQIMPILNKDRTYERFLQKNRWILKFWPNSVKVKNFKFSRLGIKPGINILENAAFWLQRKYMSSKITREVITKTRALFHPQDWGRVVLDRLA